MLGCPWIWPGNCSWCKLQWCATPDWDTFAVSQSAHALPTASAFSWVPDQVQGYGIDFQSTMQSGNYIFTGPTPLICLPESAILCLVILSPKDIHFALTRTRAFSALTAWWNILPFEIRVLQDLLQSGTVPQCLCLRWQVSCSISLPHTIPTSIYVL